MSEKCVPLNLDLTCLQVDSSLEESLLTANNVLQLVKSAEPDIITIQCHVTEESLDYLLFNKLPGNCYDKKYVRSSGRNTGRQGESRLTVSCRHQEAGQHSGGLEDHSLHRRASGPRPSGLPLPPV